jgi:hypothetical protein
MVMVSPLNLGWPPQRHWITAKMKPDFGESYACFSTFLQ